MLLCLAALPMNAAAETENDVYAALRGIGVPEDYISQAAGLLASGNSDGAGVYRNGKYYPYSELVGYIHDNSEMILEFCGIFADDSDAAMRAAERIAEQKGITVPASGTGQQSAARRAVAGAGSAGTSDSRRLAGHPQRSDEPGRFPAPFPCRSSTQGGRRTASSRLTWEHSCRAAAWS